MKEALLYEKLDGQRVRCDLCAHHCTIGPGRKGICLVRENRDGTLYTLVYGIPLSQAVDPIEKKPLFHFYPGSTAFSIATAGCNIECKFCQNWQISQFRPEQVRNFDLTPEGIVRLAKEYKTPTIAYTYSEPVVFYTYMYDTAKLAKEEGIGSVMISTDILPRSPSLNSANS